jgi:broad specificity phosphatase PhoE
VTRLLLVRHGQAQSAVDRIIGGHNGCRGLSELGRTQANRLRDRWLRTGEAAEATVLYASALPRAIETAELLQPAVGDGTLDVRSDCDLCECHVADDLDGQPVEAASARWEVMEGNVFESVGPGNESWAEFVVRASRRLLRLGADHPDETVVVACHGGIVDASFRALGGLAIQHRINVDVVNTAVTEWVTTPNGWRLARYNDHAHLDG